MLQSPLELEGADQAKVSVRSLSAWFGSTRVLRAVSFGIAAHEATAVVGPSGCGKSTFVRCLNRMHELAADARVEGEIRLDGLDVYSAQTDPVLLRRRVGMVFRRPNPFPAMSVQQNVLAGLALTHSVSLVDPEQAVETALRQAELWDEVKDRLDAPGASL
ncbi:MAG TPA: ATP-binding cassette domain-containing protein, partial [Polyangiaceae bacterium]|nr:ATP-binding cassette domain-containing protein [Polyangiaceae bacterium]